MFVETLSDFEIDSDVKKRSNFIQFFFHQILKWPFACFSLFLLKLKFQLTDIPVYNSWTHIKTCIYGCAECLNMNWVKVLEFNLISCIEIVNDGKSKIRGLWLKSTQQWSDDWEIYKAIYYGHIFNYFRSSWK